MQFQHVIAFLSINRQYPLPPLCRILFGVKFILQKPATKPKTICSRGTTASDGRIKPDLVAPGEDTLSAFGPGSDANGVPIPTLPNHCQIPSQTTARSASDAANKALGILSGTSMCGPCSPRVLPVAALSLASSVACVRILMILQGHAAHCRCHRKDQAVLRSGAQ